MKNKTFQECVIWETIYDLSYLAGQDDLLRFIEDSRLLYSYIKDWAIEFEEKYKFEDDFNEENNIDYLTALDNFYIQKRNEYIKEKYDVDSIVVLNNLFKIKC